MGYSTSIRNNSASWRRIEFTREELLLLRRAVSAFLADFGHEEQDVVDRLKQLLAKFPRPL
jgi:hypothetical protein